MDKNGSRMFVGGGRKTHIKTKEKYRNCLTRWPETEAGVILQYLDTFG
jgi:hypothetical protein